MTAYYNEIDPFAAAWLRQLIIAGQIAPGVVDERSINDIRPSDLDGFTQCHFFAGIGVWSYALRQAGWPDDRPIWTGSCPCQPFSVAGKGNGFADDRHLWPAFEYLISKCSPAAVIGEQVASKDGLAWIDLVQSDMEGQGYAFGSVDTCSAGFGAPHIRQRLYWAGFMANANRWKPEQLAGEWSRTVEAHGGRSSSQPDRHGSPGSLDDADNARLEGQRRGHSVTVGQWPRQVRPVATPGELGGLANSDGFGRARLLGSSAGNMDSGRNEERSQPGFGLGGEASELEHVGRTGPTNGFWSNADWLFCRDGKWRAVEPGTFPLANGIAARVGRLRGYGNALNAEAAKEFILAVME